MPAKEQLCPCTLDITVAPSSTSIATADSPAAAATLMQSLLKMDHRRSRYEARQDHMLLKGLADSPGQQVL
jgi:hypothetical protein